MTNDIVTKLRQEMWYQPEFKINQWERPNQTFELTRTNLIAADEIERLRAERDEVRQSYCSLMEAYRGGDGRVTANKLGWGYLFPRRPKKEDGK
jgi:hypothetical protein